MPASLLETVVFHNVFGAGAMRRGSDKNQTQEERTHEHP
jgi:hypothetical protein